MPRCTKWKSQTSQHLWECESTPSYMKITFEDVTGICSTANYCIIYRRSVHIRFLHCFTLAVPSAVLNFLTYIIILAHRHAYVHVPIGSTGVLWFRVNWCLCDHMYKHRGTHIHALLGGHYSLQNNVSGTDQRGDTLHCDTHTNGAFLHFLTHLSRLGRLVALMNWLN